MSKKKPWIVRDRDITPESAWLDRRSALKAMAAAGLLPDSWDTTHNAQAAGNIKNKAIRPQRRLQCS